MKTSEKRRALLWMLVLVAAAGGCGGTNAGIYGSLPRQATAAVAEPADGKALPENQTSVAEDRAGDASLAVFEAQHSPERQGKMNAGNFQPAAVTAREGDRDRPVYIFSTAADEDAALRCREIPGLEGSIALVFWRDSQGETRTVLYDFGEGRVLGEAPEYLLPTDSRDDYPALEKASGVLRMGERSIPLAGLSPDGAPVETSPGGSLALYGTASGNAVILDLLRGRVQSQLTPAAVAGTEVQAIVQGSFLTEELVTFVLQGAEGQAETVVYHLGNKRRFYHCAGAYRPVAAGVARWAFLPEKTEDAPFLLDLGTQENEKLLTDQTLTYMEAGETPSLGVTPITYLTEMAEGENLLFAAAGTWAVTLHHETLRVYDVGEGVLRRELTLPESLASEQMWARGVLASDGTFLLFYGEQGQLYGLPLLTSKGRA